MGAALLHTCFRRLSFFNAALHMEMLVLTSIRNTHLPGLWLLCVVLSPKVAFLFSMPMELPLASLDILALKIGLVLASNVWVTIFLCCTSPWYGLVGSGCFTQQLHQRTEVKWGGPYLSS